MAKREKVHYVDNKRLYEDMVKFIAAYRIAVKKGAEKPRIPEYVGACILKIAQRLSLRPNFIGYTYRDEMVGDGIENVLTYIHNYDPEKYNNPFAYFTQIIYFAFLRRMDKEKKQSYIKHKMLEQSSLMNLLADMPGGETNEDGHSVTVMVNVDGRLNDLVNKFEKRGVKTKKKRGVEKFADDADPPFLDPHPDDVKPENKNEETV
jgi:hypothetical protein